ncbi:type VI secretion system PAAR protein [Dickeya dianthicola]|nr:type VI secretion system PAAR protein [Dickeya dianthicola]
MSNNAAKVGDMGTDHEGFPPTAIISGSANVFIDGLPAARMSDPLDMHDKPDSPPHPRHIATGSSTVFVNGLALAITGSQVSCGGEIVGSGTVYVGDIPPVQSSLISLQGLFDEHFCLADQESHQPFEHLAYGMTTEQGQYEGMADGSGKTQRVHRLREEEITLNYVFQTRAGIR